MIDDGGPAFPLHPNVGNMEDDYHGMMLRDYFAALAMAATISKTTLLANSEGGDPNAILITQEYIDRRYKAIAVGAYLQADAMLAERENWK